MKVGDFMSTQVMAVRPDALVRDAAQLMLERKVSGLPVINDAGRVIGIVTEHDLLRHRNGSPRSQQPHWLGLMTEQAEIASASTRFRETRVDEVMTRDPVTVAEDAPIEEACSLIEKRGIKRLPVVRDGRLIGIVARADLVRALAIAVRKITDACERAARAEALMVGLQRDAMLRRARCSG
jgi:CBS domain-containing protein